MINNLINHPPSFIKEDVVVLKQHIINNQMWKIKRIKLILKIIDSPIQVNLPN